MFTEYEGKPSTVNRFPSNKNDNFTCTPLYSNEKIFSLINNALDLVTYN